MEEASTSTAMPNIPNTPVSLRWEDIVCSNSDRILRPSICVDKYQDLDKIPLNAILITKRSCDLCNRKVMCSIYDDKVLKKHILTHSLTAADNLSVKVPCPECFRSYSKAKIKKHITSKHPGANASLYDKEYVIKDYTDAVQTFKIEPDIAKEKFLERFRSSRQKKGTKRKDDSSEDDYASREDETPKRRKQKK